MKVECQSPCQRVVDAYATHAKCLADVSFLLRGTTLASDASEEYYISCQTFLVVFFQYMTVIYRHCFKEHMDLTFKGKESYLR